mmetsp:Transcript_20021/g.50473  ORF Transcript_20021/g.50473 Transcript_20021/m.50473 type:complete len:315 (+) Transcript_20021:1800-2744(+)
MVRDRTVRGSRSPFDACSCRKDKYRPSFSPAARARFFSRRSFRASSCSRQFFASIAACWSVAVIFPVIASSMGASIVGFFSIRPKSAEKSTFCPARTTLPILVSAASFSSSVFGATRLIAPSPMKPSSITFRVSPSAANSISYLVGSVFCFRRSRRSRSFSKKYIRTRSRQPATTATPKVAASAVSSTVYTSVSSNSSVALAVRMIFFSQQSCEDFSSVPGANDGWQPSRKSSSFIVRSASSRWCRQGVGPLPALTVAPRQSSSMSQRNRHAIFEVVVTAISYMSAYTQQPLPWYSMLGYGMVSLLATINTGSG